MTAMRRSSSSRREVAAGHSTHQDVPLENRVDTIPSRGGVPRRSGGDHARNRLALRNTAAAIIIGAAILGGTFIRHHIPAPEPARTVPGRDAVETWPAVVDNGPRDSDEALLLARRNLYRGHMLETARALEDDDLEHARALLDAYRPGAEKAEGTDLRGWEWYYLNALCRRERLTLKGPARSMSVLAWSPDGRFLAASSAGPIGDSPPNDVLNLKVAV